MAAVPPFAQSARFEGFEIDLRTGELRPDGGLRQQLADQPYRVLKMLISRPGELVTRDEIRDSLWPNGTVVEFDHSINAAINRLRQVLCDSAENPRYIETLARRGYRWKLPVKWVEFGAGIPESVREAPAGANASGTLIGRKVSHYRVLEVLGGGGMGVVYKAEDLRLGRRVAVKFLPEELASDASALHRLEREAQAASALNHPNICTIYEIEEHQDQPFIVMEFLEGRTLREIISDARGKNCPLEMEKLLPIAIQIADGLEVAHRNGIIHRDIKPANIFVTKQGSTKILDFGLAKLAPTVAPTGSNQTTDAEVGGDQEMRKATPIDLALSRTGLAMGTAGYMSPEQVRGDKLDARSDLFSFGLVLYEMATGQQAFQANTEPLLREAILRHSPSAPRELNPKIPAKLVRIIGKALEKGLEARYQSSLEIRSDLEKVQQELLTTARRSPLPRQAAAVVCFLLVVAWGVAGFRTRRPSADAPATHFRQLTFNSSDNPVTSGAISPNGKYLVYADAHGIHVKDIETDQSETIEQPEEANSNDVRWEIIGAGWFPDNVRFLANAHAVGEMPEGWSSQNSSIWRFSRRGEKARKLRQGAVAWSVSPDGAEISFGTNSGGLGEREIWLMDGEGHHARKLIETDEDSFVRGFAWSSYGRHGLYVRGDKTGDSFVVGDPNGNLAITVLNPSKSKRMRGDFSWLPDGHLIYQLGDPGSGYTSLRDTCNFWMMRVDQRTGVVRENPKQVTDWTGFCASNANATADGRQLSFLRLSGAHGTAYIAEVGSGGAEIRNPRHFTLEEADDFIGGWTADSGTVLVGVNRGDHYGLYKQSLNSDIREPLALNVVGGLLSDATLSPDNNWALALIWPVSPGPWTANPSLTQTVVRVPIDGGTPEMLFKVVRGGPFSCARAPANLCVIPEQTEDHKQMVVTAFDPVNGRGAELARFDLARDINLLAENIFAKISPDGTRLAVTRSPEGPIEIWSVNGQHILTIPAKGMDKLWNIAWAADGKGLYVARYVQDGTELVHVDFHGQISKLWKSSGPRCLGVPSPDGRHLAIYDWKFEQSPNMWMMNASF